MRSTLHLIIVKGLIKSFLAHFGGWVPLPGLALAHSAQDSCILGLSIIGGENISLVYLFVALNRTPCGEMDMLAERIGPKLLWFHLKRNDQSIHSILTWNCWDKLPQMENRYKWINFNKLESLIWNPIQVHFSAWIQTGILWDFYFPICSIPRFIGVLIGTMAEMPPQKQWGVFSTKFYCNCFQAQGHIIMWKYIF